MLKNPIITAEINGTVIEYLLSGVGGPTIVLINGGDGPIEGWYKILPAICEASTTLTYNRAGVARSSKPQGKQTSDVVIAQLRKLLAHLALAPPYLLVGHSLGGLHANFFARMHPNEICGLVLIEATAPEDVSLMQASQSRLQMRLQRLSDWLFDRAGIGEARNASISASMVQAAGRFPDVPLAVVSGGHAAMPPHMPEQAKSGRYSTSGD